MLMKIVQKGKGGWSYKCASNLYDGTRNNFDADEVPVFLEYNYDSNKSSTLPVEI